MSVVVPLKETLLSVHKTVMLMLSEAREAYLRNYGKDWQGLGRITGVDKDTFDKWLDSSDRKVKAFGEHSIVKSHMVERGETAFDSALKQLDEREISIDNPDLLQEYGLRNVTLSRLGDRVTLTHFIAADRGQGNGTRFMEDLSRMADERGWTLALTPDTSFGASSVSRLKKFYKRFGFKDNKGRNTDFYTSESMIRRPKDWQPNSPERREQTLRDAVVDHLREKGVNVSDDWQEGQRILDEYNGNGQVKKMGTTTNNRMSDVAIQFADKQLTDQQSVIASVYTGEKDNQTATFKREGSAVRMKFQQGEDTKAGTKHSLFAHYGTTKGVISADDILRIPDVIEKGNRKQKGKNVEYTLKDGKTTYTVYAKVKGGIEVFQDFYSSWKIKNKETSTSKPSITQGENTQSAQSDDANASSGAKVQQNPETGKDSEDKIDFHKVTDTNTLNELEKGPTVKRYRAMQLIDGKLYPPMSAKVDGEMREPTEIGVWEQSEERPDLIKNGKFVLNKGQKGQGSVPAAYNPYFHTSTSGLNDQFTSAYKRPELVVVEVEIPESELTSGYKAEGAKDAVGNVDWHSGVVNGQLPADRQRQVTLSRYSKVNRIVPDSEVADMIAKQLEGTDIEIPYNVVTTAQRSELEKRGVKISSTPAGKVTDDINGNPIKQPNFFKTRDGHAYGYTYKGKIYIDPRIATSETPVHEYSHLWAEMKRQTSPEEWEDIKRVMLTDKMVQPIIEKVKREYPELTKEGKEDDFIEEIITQFSGKRGSERLREIANEIAAENGGVFGKAEAVTAMQRLKNILNHFWAGVAKMMGWKYRNANQIADRIMADMLNGVNPREKMRAARDERRDMRMDERDRKQSQLDIINENNPADESLGEHTWIKSVDDIKNFDEAMSEYGEDENLAPDYTADMARKAKETGEITVYSSKPIGNGIFVTPSKMEAKNYAGEGRVYSKRVRTSDVAWIDGMQGQYAKVDEAKMQKVDGDIHSDNFKNFFGDWEKEPENASKVVDKNGKPLVVQHGTGDEFYTFDIGQLGKASGNKGWFGEGFYFTPWEDQARGYAKDASRKSGNPERLMPVYLNIRNPQVVDISERDSFVPEEGTDGVIVTITLPKGSPFRKKGVKFDKDRYIYEIKANSPNQIKSATENVGTYDPSNPDIRFQKMRKEIDHVQAIYDNGTDVEYTNSEGEKRSMRIHTPASEVQEMKRTKFLYFWCSITTWRLLRFLIV